MRRLFFSLFVLVLCGGAYAQKCDCLKELQFLEEKTEQNLPAYYDQVITAKREAAYQKHKQECNAIAAGLSDTTECVYLVAKYISFFRDEHLFINYNDTHYPFSWQKNDTVAMRAFFQHEKIYPIAAPGFEHDPVEGTWVSKDGNYTVQIAKNKEKLWDYTALILEGDKKFWTKGQLKFGLKQTGANTFESIYLYPERKPRQLNAVLEGNTLTLGRTNIFYRKAQGKAITAVANDDATLSSKVEFRSLSSKTNYLRIPSFEFDAHVPIDSVVKANLKSLISKPYLIIDVRNNPGGAFRSYQGLMPLIAHKKFMTDPSLTRYYAGPDVIKYYIDTKYLNSETKQDSLDDEEVIAQMLKYKGGYTPAQASDTFTVDTLYHYPLKVAIIANRLCASTTEGFMIQALESPKVKVYGENTMGAVTYGDWRSVPMPVLPIALSMGTQTSTYARYENMESVGVTPYMKLVGKPEKNWIEMVQRDIEK